MRLAFANEHYINGAWRKSAESYAVRNPATGDVIAEVAKAGAAETHEAIRAAEIAFPAWRSLTAKERGARVRRWGELMLEHRDSLGNGSIIRAGQVQRMSAGAGIVHAEFNASRDCPVHR